MTHLALAPDLKCACGGALSAHEGSACAFCLRDQRGDDQLLSHDDRGWLGEPGERVPCGCGVCGMVAVPIIEEPERRAPAFVPGVAGPASPWGREEIIVAIKAWAEHYGEPPTTSSWQKSSEDHPGHARVAAVFGSWSAGLEAAGFDGRRRAAGAWQAKANPGAGKAHAVGSGESAHAWADALGEIDGVEVRFRHEIPEHSQKLLASLGATYVIDSGAPVCVTPCGRAECGSPAPPASKLSSLDSLLEQLAGELEQ